MPKFHFDIVKFNIELTIEKKDSIGVIINSFMITMQAGRLVQLSLPKLHIDCMRVKLSLSMSHNSS